MLHICITGTCRQLRFSKKANESETRRISTWVHICFSYRHCLSMQMAISLFVWQHHLARQSSWAHLNVFQHEAVIWVSCTVESGQQWPRVSLCPHLHVDTLGDDLIMTNNTVNSCNDRTIGYHLDSHTYSLTVTQFNCFSQTFSRQ